jgi:hypothetical protein
LKPEQAVEPKLRGKDDEITRITTEMKINMESFG